MDSDESLAGKEGTSAISRHPVEGMFFVSVSQDVTLN
jgi:hypothetical protein